MRTSEEIYHRIRWDPRFDPARFVLGVHVRDAAPKRVALPAFVPGGDIPWHRVLFIEADGEVVWDRASGTDRIDASTAGRVVAARRLRAPYFTARTPVGATGRVGSALRVVTWNTLWDRYDSDRIDTARRRPLLLAELARADADVIALQEVEPGLLALLRETAWVRDAYAFGTDRAGADVTEHGLLLLSRLPVLEAGVATMGPHKAVVALVLESVAGPVVVANTHLTSDHSADGAGSRQRELARLTDILATVDGDVVLVGDFNDGGEQPTATLGLRDAWTERHGASDATPTFDPTTNSLAAIMSLSGRASRLDRVLVRGGLRAEAARLAGTAAVDGLFVSDHYGIVVDLGVDSGLSGTLSAGPTARTAVAWLPPHRLWPPLQRIRAAHDPQVDRWPPHVNVLFGFVPEADFETALPLLGAAVADVAPFPVRLAANTSEPAWLDPAADGGAPWAALHQAVRRPFPACRGRVEGYTPHLTLGRGAGPVDLPEPAPRVDELAVLSRRGDEPMRVRATVSLGTGIVRWVDEPGPADAPPVTGAGSVHKRLSAALADGVVHVVGSRRLGCALPDADLDLVAVLPGVVDLADVTARVRTALPELDAVRPVPGARVPGLRMRLGRLAVDLVVVAAGSVPPDEAVRRRAELDRAAAVAVSAVSDADAVLAAVAGRHAEFVTLARTVKAWARVRGLDSAPHGGIPGLGWTVLAALALDDFFGTWAAWDWREPVGAVIRDGLPMAIGTPSEPSRSCTEQVGAGMRDLVTQELYRAWELLADGGIQGLLAPPPMHRRHAAWAVLTVRPMPGTALDLTLGRVRGRVRSLLTALEEAGHPDVHAWPRAFATGADEVRYAIGLGRNPPDAAALDAIAAGWVRGLAGVEVTWADGGAVPTLR